MAYFLERSLLSSETDPRNCTKAALVFVRASSRDFVDRSCPSGEKNREAKPGHDCQLNLLASSMFIRRIISCDVELRSFENSSCAGCFNKRKMGALGGIPRTLAVASRSCF